MSCESFWISTRISVYFDCIIHTSSYTCIVSWVHKMRIFLSSHALANFFFLHYVSIFLRVDAQWHSREDVKRALTFAEYKKAQTTAAVKVEQMCKGVEKGQNFSADFNVESGELAPMFIPGPFAIAHHLISSWVYQDTINGVEALLKQPSGSMSSL
jgi:hypothetical protein